MRKKVTLYLDTSVPSAYFDDRTPQRQRMTRGWWDNELKNYNVIISEITERELKDTKDNIRREKLLELVRDIEIVTVTEECMELAGEYVKEMIIPQKYEDDAIHIAVASVYDLDILLSWNFKHIVRYETKKRVNGLNLLRGYGEIQIESIYEMGGVIYE